MKLSLGKYTRNDPEWQDLIGKSKSDVEEAIEEFWQYPLKTIATGYNQYECVRSEQDY